MRDNDSGDLLTDQHDIYRVLRSLQLTRSLLTVKFGKDPRTYSSLVIHTDLSKTEFVIDEIMSEDGNRRLAKGEEFTVMALYEGIEVMFTRNKTLRKSPAGFNHSFVVGFPKMIRHKQRRDAYRAVIERSVNSMVIVNSDRRKQPLQARIVDMSINGIGCEFDHYIKPEIQPQEHFGPCEIAIDEMFFLSCALIAKHPRFLKMTGTYYCGFEFFRLDRSQQKQVDRYVFAIQREAKKNRDSEKSGFTEIDNRRTA